jgi:hypothetical protein
MTAITKEAHLVLLVANPLTPPRHGICNSHRRPLRDLHPVRICLDELAQDFRFRVLWIPKVHHFIEQLVLHTQNGSDLSEIQQLNIK